MKTKVTFLSIIIIGFIAVMYFYHDKLTLTELILACTTAGTTLTTVWKWFNEAEVQKTFKEEIGLKYSTFKRSRKNEQKK